MMHLLSILLQRFFHAEFAHAQAIVRKFLGLVRVEIVDVIRLAKVEINVGHDYIEGEGILATRAEPRAATAAQSVRV